MKKVKSILRICLPPAIPFIFVVGLCLLVLVSIANSPPTIIDGRVDNAPYYAAGCLLYLSPLFLVLGVILNLCDTVIERRLVSHSWLSAPLTVSICALFGLVLAFSKVGIPSFPGVILLFGLSSVLVFPISITRKLMTGRRSEQPPADDRLKPAPEE